MEARVEEQSKELAGRYVGYFSPQLYHFEALLQISVLLFLLFIFCSCHSKEKTEEITNNLQRKIKEESSQRR